MKKRRFQIILIIVSALLVVSLSRSVYDLWNRRDIVYERKVKLEALQKSTNALKKKFAEVQTSAFVEQEARERLGMSKDGETVVIVATDMPSTLKQTEDPYTTLPHWKQWWEVFF